MSDSWSVCSNRVVNMISILAERLALIADGKCLEGDWPNRWLDQPNPLSCWEAWTLLGLVRHRQRQEFVAETMTSRLGADLQALAKSGSMGHPDCPGRGVVPGLSDWAYNFHGCGCRLTHRGTGEAIDVDFCDSSSNWFDSFFFSRYLESLKTPTFVEQRLIQLHPSFRTVLLAIDRLRESDLLERYEDRGAFRLAFDHEELSGLLERIEPKWESAETQWQVASAVGDWFLMERTSPDKRREVHIARRVDACRQERSQWLVERFRGGNRSGEAMKALAEIESDQLDAMIEEALNGTDNAAMGAALDTISQTADKWRVQLEALLNRNDPTDSVPAPGIHLTCCELLLKNGHSEGMADRLLAHHSQFVGEAAIVALEHLPDVAIPLFRRALRSTIPCNRVSAAASLAVLDQPWCRAELLAVLEESDDPAKTAECRSALLETHSRECHERVMAWEELNPHEAEPGKWITMEEAMLRSRGEFIRYEMQELHDRLMPLRGVLP